MLVCGHRGFRQLAWENTICSFERAVEFGAQMIEFDLRLSSDSKLVVHHDLIFAPLERPISEIPYSEIVYAAEKDRVPPTLEEVLESMRGKCLINCEIKDIRAAAPAAKMLKSMKIEDPLISSFQPKALAASLNEVPEIRRGYLLGGGKAPSISDLTPWKVARSLEVECLICEYHLLPYIIHNDKRRAALKLWAWNADSEAQIERLKEYRTIDVVITDSVNLARRIIDAG